MVKVREEKEDYQLSEVMTLVLQESTLYKYEYIYVSGYLQPGFWNDTTILVAVWVQTGEHGQLFVLELPSNGVGHDRHQSHVSVYLVRVVSQIKILYNN